MNPQRLVAWRRRLGLSSVMDKRLARMIRMIQREEREACVQVVAVECVLAGEAYEQIQLRLVRAIMGHKDEP